MKSKNNVLFSISALALSFSVLFSATAQASVVMTGTRVIFPAGQNEKTVHLQNKDSNPNIVQVWLDNGDESSTPDTANAPIMASPQIFKTAPNQGQMVRLIFTEDKSALPQDRESIFYMNFSEIPATKSTDADKNKLMVVFKNRVKVLYRPERLAYPSHEMGKHIQYQWVGNGANSKIQLHNNSPYYASFADLSITSAGKNTVVQKNKMIAPFSSAEWPVSMQNINTANAKISLNLINDYGIAVANELSPKQE